MNGDENHIDEWLEAQYEDATLIDEDTFLDGAQSDEWDDYGDE